MTTYFVTDFQVQCTIITKTDSRISVQMYNLNGEPC